MYKRYGDRVAFLGVYVREAHPTDGWSLESNSRIGIEVKQPTIRSERFDVAEKCCVRLNMNIPLLVDELDDRVGRSYSGMPDRLYLIDRGGLVAYKGGRGPYGFKPAELEQSLILLLHEDEGSLTNASSEGVSRKP
jgi:Iodothyronine deiodinase